MVRFYTLPPLEIPYPYVLINANRPENGLRYIVRHRDIIESVIIDSGVEIFRDPSVKDYPPNHFEHLVSLYKRVRSYVSGVEIYVTVPDYPDDYYHRSLWISDEITNIERTLENIKYALTSYPEVKWLIPVQGHYEKPSSIVYALELYQKHDVPLDDYIALANLCVSRKCSVIQRTISLAYYWLVRNGYEADIHVFGPSVSCLRHAKKMVYSFDSMAWTKPRTFGGSSAWNGRERVYLFITFLHRYADLIDIPALPYSMRKRLEVEA